MAASVVTLGPNGEIGHSIAVQVTESSHRFTEQIKIV